MEWFGHVVEIPSIPDLDAFLPDDVEKIIDDLTRKIIAVFPNAIEVHRVNKFDVPDPNVKMSNIPIGNEPFLEEPSLAVTLDDVTKDMDWANGPWADPGFDGGKGSNVTVTLGHAGTGINEAHGGEFPFQDKAADGVYDGNKKRILEHYDPFGGQPLHPHETYTAELIARSSRPNGSFRGPAYRALIYDGRCLDFNGSGDTIVVVDAMNWLASKNVDAVNMSLGGPHDNVLDEAVRMLWHEGIVVVCASGNSGYYPPDCDMTINSPADANQSIAVMAASIAIQDPNSKGQRYVQTWSSRGKRLDGTPVPYPCCAPGVTMSPGFGDPINSGTSFAAPCTTAVVLALIHKAKRVYPNMTKQDRAALVRDTLMKGCISLGYDTSGNHTPEGAFCIQGNGFVIASKAYDLLGGSPPQPNRKGAPSVSPIGTITIHAKQPPAGSEATVTTATADKTDYDSGEPIKISVTVHFQKDLAPLPNGQVQVNLGGMIKTVATDQNGVATATFTDTTVTQDEDRQFNASFLGS